MNTIKIGTFGRLAIGVVVLAISAMSVPTWAACTKTGTTMLWNVNPGNISVPYNTAPGTVIYTRQLTTVQQGNVIFNCTSATDTTHYLLRSGTLVPGFSDVYTTGVTGVGVRIRDTSNRYFGIPGARENLPIGPTRATMTPFTYELLATGTITPGPLTTGRQADWNVTGMYPFGYIQVTGGGVSVPAVCSVTTPAIPVPLNIVMVREFRGIGTPSRDVPFTIDLACAANTNVSVQLDGVADTSGRPGTFALNLESGAATGVGVEVLYNNTPVTIGRPLPVGNSGGSNGPYPVNLIGRYVQTTDRITGGLANATATFTMIYN